MAMRVRFGGVRWGLGLLAVAMLAMSLPAAAQSTLATVKKRGTINCGVNGQAAGFSLLDPAKNEWSGMDADFCRAVAAAVLGDARKVTFVPLTVAKRFPALIAADVDLVVRNAAETMQRAVGTDVRFVIANYYDGQAFVVPKKQNIERIADLDGRSVCVLKNSTFEFHLDLWARQFGFKVEPRAFATQDEMYKAFYAGQCNAVTQYQTTLVAAIVHDGNAADYKMLPGSINEVALGPYVRRGDEQWFDIVRWTQMAMLRGEELGISRSNVEGMSKSQDGRALLLLGVTPGGGKALGLDEAWAFNILKQVGNYAEVYDRNVGKNSPLNFGRGVNALWSSGGLMFASPLR